MVMKRTEADSAVQGTILILAVNVIIAAVIASFAFGVAGGLTNAKTVAAIATQMENDITVTWYGGQDNEFVSFYNVTLVDTITQPGTVPGYPPIAGNTTVFPGQGTSGNDPVVITAVFTDGTVQVVLDTYV
jgi:hypothetical protein